MEDLITSLSQAFAIALLVERVTKSLLHLNPFATNVSDQDDKWTKLDFVVGTSIAFIICFGYEFDLLKFMMTAPPFTQYPSISYLFTAAFIGSGSSAINKVISVLSESVKGRKSAAQARTLYYNARVDDLVRISSSNARYGGVDVDVLRDFDTQGRLTYFNHNDKANTALFFPTLIERRAEIALMISAQHHVFSRGSSEFVCKVLSIKWEPAYDLMGDAPKVIEDWSLIPRGAVVGWKNTDGTSHVAIYMRDLGAKFLHVAEPASTRNPNPKVTALDSFPDYQKLYLSSRFGF